MGKRVMDNRWESIFLSVWTLCVYHSLNYRNSWPYIFRIPIETVNILLWKGMMSVGVWLPSWSRKFTSWSFNWFGNSAYGGTLVLEGHFQFLSWIINVSSRNTNCLKFSMALTSDSSCLKIIYPILYLKISSYLSPLFLTFNSAICLISRI